MPGRLTPLVLIATAVVLALGGQWAVVGRVAGAPAAASDRTASAQDTGAAASAAPSTTPAPASGEATTAAAQALAQDWVDSEGSDLVARSLGPGASTGTLIQAHAWAPGFLDGSAPYAAPVPQPVWAATVEVGGEPTAVLVIRVGSQDADGAAEPGGVSGVLVDDADLATGLAGLEPQEVVVHEAVDPGGISRQDAWYAVARRTVRALGSAASGCLAGVVPMATYSAVLRDRSSPTAVAAEQPRQDEGGSDLAVWLTSAGVLLIGLTILVLTIRHERRVMAPLRG
ncbi:hypothetical protein [Actinomyces howellii]|uniref:Uncharacterized protein n=1 Tax=Actinomyces howellii TaxID=52771 RepID=A0A448HG15_9ACTO|nr:hypothetical protein [Actinomyces howellii]VEG27528.1 Uncharacterised protein [Actinomyces howellii]